MKTSDALEIIDEFRFHVEQCDELNKSIDSIIDAMTKRLEMARKGVPVFKKQKDCRFASDTGDLYLKKAPCKGNKIICHCEDNPIDEWYSTGCNPARCNFYEAV